MKTNVRFTHLLQVRVPNDLHDAIVELCNANMTTPSAWIRVALLEKLGRVPKQNEAA